jgi:inner membrane protein
MHRRGHIGITLLIGSGFLVLWGPVHGIIATGLMLHVMMLPDIDQRIKDVRHRGPTHTLAFALGAGVVMASTVAYPVEICQEAAVRRGFLSDFIINPLNIWLFINSTVSAALTGHIVGDMITIGGGYKIRPLWPLSNRMVALGMCRSDSKPGNAILFVCGCSVLAFSLLSEFLLFI